MSDPVLDAIHRRRVTRAMTDEPVAREQVETILDAARWAPTAGNRHLQRFVATTDPGTLRVLRMVSPGMIARPTAAIAVCIDHTLVEQYGFPPENRGPWIDVGTATATILLAAQAVGVADGAARGGVAGEQGAVLAQVDHRRRRDRAITEADHLDLVVADDRRGDEGRPDVDTQAVHLAASPILLRIVTVVAGKAE